MITNTGDKPIHAANENIMKNIVIFSTHVNGHVKVNGRLSIFFGEN